MGYVPVLDGLCIFPAAHSQSLTRRCSSTSRDAPGIISPAGGSSGLHSSQYGAVVWTLAPPLITLLVEPNVSFLA